MIIEVNCSAYKRRLNAMKYPGSSCRLPDPRFYEWVNYSSLGLYVFFHFVASRKPLSGSSHNLVELKLNIDMC